MTTGDATDVRDSWTTAMYLRLLAWDLPPDHPRRWRWERACDYLITRFMR